MSMSAILLVVLGVALVGNVVFGGLAGKLVRAAHPTAAHAPAKAAPTPKHAASTAPKHR